MREYTLNFFVWWYGYKLKELTLFVVTKFVYFLNLTNVIPMLKNISSPLFGDESTIGRSIGFGIRLVWIVLGLVICTILILPYLLLIPIFAALPFVPLVHLVITSVF